MGTQKKSKYSKPKSGRVFNMVQYEYNPITGQPFDINGTQTIYDESFIKTGLNHQSIRRYAYIRHDEDHYSEIDCEKFNEKYSIVKTINDKKPPHWHIVIEVPNKCPVSLIAKWFSLPENQVEVPNDKGKTPIHTRGAEKVFLECVGYLIHSDIRQQALDKHLYDPKDVVSNFDWETEVEAIFLRREKYGRSVSDKEWYRNEVLTGNIRPKDMMKDSNLITFYTSDADMLNKLRTKYLTELAPMPTTRLNYYICGDKGGIGKGIASRALARSLYPDIKDDDDIFFSVGGKKTAFDDYDGQPVVIWNDIRPLELLDIFGGRGQMFDSLDIHPNRKREHIKYGKIVLTNEVNIFNAILSYSEFLDGLSGEYTDKNNNLVKSELSVKEQAYRRFPIIIPVHENDFDILINKGFIGEGSYTEYYEHQRITAHFKDLHIRLQNRQDLIRQLERQTMQPVIEAHNIVLDKEHPTDEFDGMTDDKILQNFADCGTAVDIFETDEFKKWMEEKQIQFEKELEEFLQEQEDNAIKSALQKTVDKLLTDYRQIENHEKMLFTDYVKSCEEDGIVSKGFYGLCDEYGLYLSQYDPKYDLHDRQY